MRAQEVPITYNVESMKKMAKSTGFVLNSIARLRVVLLLILSYNNNDALALSLSPPPNSRPVIIGTTSDYSTILFGKLQRAANLCYHEERRRRVAESIGKMSVESILHGECWS